MSQSSGDAAARIECHLILRQLRKERLTGAHLRTLPHLLQGTCNIRGVEAVHNIPYHKYLICKYLKTGFETLRLSPSQQPHLGPICTSFRDNTTSLELIMPLRVNTKSCP